MSEKTYATETETAEENTLREEEQRLKDREDLQRHIGKRLTAARRESGLNAKDIAGSLRFLPEYVRAFDSGNWDKMPEEVYTLGFLRQYARFIGLDLSDEIERLKSGEYHLSKPFTIPDPPLAPNRKWAIVSAALFVTFFIIVNLAFNGEKQQDPAPVIGEQALDIPATSADSGAEKQQALASSTRTHHYHFSASGEAVWLQVFDASFELLKEALLRPGESLRFDYGGAAIFITSGNPASLQVRIDGKIAAATGSLGEAGRVLREHRLTPPVTE